MVAALIGGCGSSTNAVVTAPVVGAARTFSLAGFKPSGPVIAHRPTSVSFTVQLPDGKPLTRYRTGPGPHTGVHMIIVRNDLAYIIHDHPPIGPNGALIQTVRFPTPGPYRVLVDIYPDVPGLAPNFQLHQTLTSPAPITRGHSRRSNPISWSTATTSTCSNTPRCTPSKRNSFTSG